mmetsp:Transcript_4371/g.3922  ORF Transcript_4371/g.3922 Transcript_4371/m.3922 type:complete len:526 (-) Transcript_4371:58-1635(-)
MSLASAYSGLQVLLLDPLVQVFSQLELLGQSTYFIHLPYLDAQIQPLADSLGMGLPLIKYTLSLFLVYPFAAVLRTIPNPSLKHLFSLAGGLFLVQWVFGADWIHSFVSSFVTYLLCLIVPGKTVTRLVFIWVMGYMTCSHIYRMYVSYLSGVFDFTGTQMVLTMKLTSFAYNLSDGIYDRKAVFPETPYTDRSKAATYQTRAKFAIKKIPNLLQFFGYIYCFTCLLAGPAFEYNDYIESIDGTAFINPKIEDDKIKKNGSSPKPPSSVLPALYTLFIGVLCLVGHLTVSGKYPLSKIYDPELVDGTGHVARYIYTWIALFGERLKYYFAWKVAEGASILAGFGFEGYDSSNRPKGWSAVENISILGFETAPNTQILSRSWNKRTQGWLERYTYLRTNKSLVATYFISAIWHGLYPGFFLFFMSIPVLTEIERLMKEKVNPFLVPSYNPRDIATYPKTTIGFLYWVVSAIVTSIAMNYIVQVFPLQSWGRCHAALGSYYYVPHIVIIVFYVLLKLSPKPKIKKNN